MKLMNHFLDFVELHMDGLKLLVETVEAGPKQKWDEYGQQFDQYTADWNQDEIADYVDHVYDEIAQVRDDLPRLARYSLVTAIFGSFESEMKRMCHYLKFDNPGLPEPPKYGFLNDYQSYLEHNGYAGKFGPEWDEVAALRPLRNIIAHHGGELAAGKQNDTVAATAHIQANAQFLSVKSDGLVYIKEGYCLELLEKVRTAIESING